MMGVVKFTGGNAKDTPGDKTSYIFPGNTSHENYRVMTFKQFPGQCNPLKLARIGFYYIGFKDRVKCFSCQYVVESWNEEDDEEDPRWHATNCGMILNTNIDNVPLPRPFTMPTQRNVTESSLQKQRERQFPCLQPKYIHMKEFPKRLESFSIGWDYTKLRATPRELALCGLFFIGEDDKTQCFYCGGGLQNWAYEDDIWSEHTKWYPGCEYVLQMKGIDFVKTIYQESGNISRPPIEIRSARVRELLRLDFTTLPQAHEEPEPEQPDIVIQSFLENSSIVNQVRAMGFEHSDIKSVISRKFLEGADIAFTVEELVAELTALRNSQSIPQQSQTQSITSSEDDVTDANIRQKFAEITYEKICKVCLREEAGILLLPCGHLSICSSCSEETTKCPICSHGIFQKINVYRP